MNSGKDYKARETDVAQPIMAGGPVGGNQGGDYIVGALTAKGPEAMGAPEVDAGHYLPVYPIDTQNMTEGGAQFEGPHDTANIRAAKYSYQTSATNKKMTAMSKNNNSV